LDLAGHAPVLDDDTVLGDLLEPLVDVPVVVGEVVVGEPQELVPDRVVGVDPAPEVLPGALDTPDRVLDGVEGLVDQGVDLLVGDVLLAEVERRDDVVDLLAQVVDQCRVAGAGAGVGDLVLLQQDEHHPEGTAAGVLGRVVFLQLLGQRDRPQGRAELPDAPRHHQGVARVDVAVAQVAVAPVARHDRALALQEGVVADDDAVTVDLEEHRPQVRLGAAEAVALLVAANLVE
jgi:hypothetical protein